MSLALAFQVGCSSSEETSASLDYEGTSYDAATESEAGVFADEFRTAIYHGDADAGARLFDMDEVLSQVTAGIDVPAEFKKGFLNGARNSIKTQGLLAELIKAAQGGASYEILRQYEKDGEQRVIFRLVQDEGGVNYHDFRVVKLKSGKIAAVDTHIAATGEQFTRTLRRLYLSAAKSVNRSALERLAGADADAAAASDLMLKMATDMQSRNFRGIVNSFESAAENVKKDKSLLMLYCTAAMQTQDDQTYMRSIEAFRKYHPTDPAVDFMSLDWLILKERYDEALASLDKIKKSVGGDGYLDALRAELLYSKGEKEEALKVSDEAIATCPDLAQVYWLAISLTLREKKFARTTELLIELDKNFALEFEDLRTVPEYAEYVASPEHQKWLDHRVKVFEGQ